MRIIYFIFVTAFGILSCADPANKLFWIDEPSNQRNDMLFMAESTNVKSIKSDSISYFLTEDEISVIPKIEFKNFGEVYKNDSFRVNVLLRIAPSSGRDYQFLIRSYNKSSKEIDTFVLASWIESESSFCYGSLSKELIIERKCNRDSLATQARIMTNGQIVEKN